MAKSESEDLKNKSKSTNTEFKAGKDDLSSSPNEQQFAMIGAANQ